MLKEIEMKLLVLWNSENSTEGRKEVIDWIIASLPQENFQGEIKDQIDGNLATVEVSEQDITYIRTGNRLTKQDWLKIVAKLDWSEVTCETISWNGEVEETP